MVMTKCLALMRGWLKAVSSGSLEEREGGRMRAAPHRVSTVNAGRRGGDEPRSSARGRGKLLVVAFIVRASLE